MSSIREAAQAAYEPQKQREETQREGRGTRAARYFRETFKEDVTPTFQKLVFDDDKRTEGWTFEVDGLTLVYVGSRRGKDYMGTGFVVLEQCANCERWHGAAFVDSLTTLGRYIANPNEERYQWECRSCHKPVPAPLPNRKARRARRSKKAAA